jgi:FlaG/FlaF family flagellin (archaellin)
MLKTPGKGLKKEAAVSEVMGIVLLTGIVVIMLSTLGVYVFSMEGPDDVPHTNVQEIMDISTDTIYLKNNGGEPVSTENLRIIVNINDRKYEYPSSKIYESLRNSNVWKMGDTIEINTKDTWGINLRNNDKVELFLVDAPSNELIQKSTLTNMLLKDPELSLHLTPMGDITDTSESKKDEKGYGNRIQVRVVDSTKTDDATDPKIAKEDRKCTTYYPAKDTINTSIYQQLDFGIKPRAYGIRQGDTFSNVSLIIVYYSNDNSIKEFRLKFYDIDEYGNGKWVYYSNQLPKHTDQFESETIDLTEYINTPKDLESFKVRIEASTESSESAGKAIFIDYMALWLEKENNLAHPESVE